MKPIILIGFMLAGPAFAQEVFTPVPPALRDAEIEVHLKAGGVNKYSANEYKVVPRASSKAVQAKIDALRKELAETKAALKEAQEKLSHPMLAARRKCEPVEVVKEVKVPLPPHHVYALAGAGSDGVQEKDNETGVLVKQRYAPVFGLGYDYTFENLWSVGGQATRGVAPESDTYSGLVSVGFRF